VYMRGKHAPARESARDSARAQKSEHANQRESARGVGGEGKRERERGREGGREVSRVRGSLQEQERKWEKERERHRVCLRIYTQTHSLLLSRFPSCSLCVALSLTHGRTHSSRDV